MTTPARTRVLIGRGAGQRRLAGGGVALPCVLIVVLGCRLRRGAATTTAPLEGARPTVVVLGPADVEVVIAVLGRRDHDGPRRRLRQALQRHGP